MTSPAQRIGLTVRLADLGGRLLGLRSVAVAFSGGADSAFLLAAAVRALGPAQVLAVTAVSPSLASAELEPAREFAASLGVLHLTPGTAESDLCVKALLATFADGQTRSMAPSMRRAPGGRACYDGSVHGVSRLA